MLVLKLLLVPAFLALVSLAGRRWGPAVAGWLAGLPLVAGPILLLLALERGEQFGAGAAVASLSAVLASLCFNLAYAWTSLRRAWPAALAAGLAAWSAAALALAQLPASVWPALAAALFALVLAPWLSPEPGEPPAFKGLPKGSLLARMAAGVALTVSVTFAAASIGPTWSGLLTVFPVLGLVLAVFSHIGNGASFVVTLLRAMATGMWSFAVFCLCLALTLPSHGIAASFGLSVLLTLAAQWALGRHARR